MALRAQRGARPGVAARGPRDPPHGRRRLLPPRDRPRRPDGRGGLRVGLLAVLGRWRPLPRARRGDGPLQGLLGRPDAYRVGQPGRCWPRRTAPPRSCGASRHWAEAATHSRPPPGWRWTTGGSGPRRATRYGSTSPTRGPPRRGSLPSLQDLSKKF